METWGPATTPRVYTDRGELFANSPPLGTQLQGTGPRRSSLASPCPPGPFDVSSMPSPRRVYTRTPTPRFVLNPHDVHLDSIPLLNRSRWAGTQLSLGRRVLRCSEASAPHPPTVNSCCRVEISSRLKRTIPKKTPMSTLNRLEFRPTSTGKVLDRATDCKNADPQPGRKNQRNAS